jgi:hypothetical protein
MFGGNSSDKLAAALEAYRRDFSRRIKPAENQQAEAAKVLIAEA